MDNTFFVTIAVMLLVIGAAVTIVYFVGSYIYQVIEELREQNRALEQQHRWALEMAKMNLEEREKVIKSIVTMPNPSEFT